MEENDIIWEDVLSEEYLGEMAKIFSKYKNNYKIHIQITPDPNYIGDPYFKVFNSKEYGEAKKVARLHFLKPELIINHRERNGKKEWKLEDIDTATRKEIIDFLNSPSSIPNITVWTYMRYLWNESKVIKINSDITEYMNGTYDKIYFGNPDYVPYNIPMPDYLNLRNQDKKRK